MILLLVLLLAFGIAGYLIGRNISAHDEQKWRKWVGVVVLFASAYVVCSLIERISEIGPHLTP